MSKDLLARYDIRPHGMRQMSNRYIGAGVCLLLLQSGAAIVPALIGASTFLLPVGIAAIALGVHLRKVGAAVQIVNKAFQEGVSGRISNAIELLDYTEANFDTAHVRRAVAAQRAAYALRSGKLEEAAPHATAVIDWPVARLTRDHERVMVMAGHAIRAMVRASRKETDAAQADIAAVRQSPDAAPESLARAEVAAAILLEHQGTDALRAHLDEHRHLLHEYTNPRDRALVRGFERMLLANPQSVYRKPAPTVRTVDDPTDVDWVGQIAPNAAPFVREIDKNEDVTALDEETTEPAKAAAKKRLDAMKPPALKVNRRRIALWVLLVSVIIAVFVVVAEDRAEVPAAPTTMADMTVWAAAVGMLINALVFGLVGVNLYWGRKYGRRLLHAQQLMAVGRHTEADEACAELSKAPTKMIAAQADGMRSAIAMRLGRFDAALALVNTAVSRLNSQLRAAASDLLLPGLLASRAALLAALGRNDDARAELALLEDTFPGFAFLARAKVQVALASAASSGDLAAAARLGDIVLHSPMGSREELLIDLARAATRHGSSSAGEVERLKAALKHDPDTRRWVEHTAPMFIPAFEEATRMAALKSESVRP